MIGETIYEKIRFVFIVILCLFSAISYAAGYITPLGTGVKIDKVQILGSSGMVIWLKEDMPNNPDNCSQKKRLQIKSDISQYDAMVGSCLVSSCPRQRRWLLVLWLRGNVFLGPRSYLSDYKRFVDKLILTIHSKNDAEKATHFTVEHQSIGGDFN